MEMIVCERFCLMKNLKNMVKNFYLNAIFRQKDVNISNVFISITSISPITCCKFLSCSQMPAVFYHCIIHGLGFFILLSL